MFCMPPKILQSVSRSITLLPTQSPYKKIYTATNAHSAVSVNKGKYMPQIISGVIALERRSTLLPVHSDTVALKMSAKSTPAVM